MFYLHLKWNTGHHSDQATLALSMVAGIIPQHVSSKLNLLKVSVRYFTKLLTIYSPWRLTQGQTPESESSEHYVWFSVEVAIQQTFHSDAHNKGPPEGPGCQFIKTQTMRYTATFWVLVRLLSCFSVDLQDLSCARGREGYSINLRVPGGDEGPFVLSENHLLCQLPRMWLR